MNLPILVPCSGVLCLEGPNLIRKFSSKTHPFQVSTFSTVFSFAFIKTCYLFLLISYAWNRTVLCNLSDRAIMYKLSFTHFTEMLFEEPLVSAACNCFVNCRHLINISRTECIFCSS